MRLLPVFVAVCGAAAGFVLLLAVGLTATFVAPCERRASHRESKARQLVDVLAFFCGNHVSVTLVQTFPQSFEREPLPPRHAPGLLGFTRFAREPGGVDGQCLG